MPKLRKTRSSTRRKKKPTEDVETVPFANGFKIPTEQQCLDAMRGARANNPIHTELERLIPLFEPIPEPTHRDDWLAQYCETKQSFRQWKYLRSQYKEDATRDTIYLAWIQSSSTDCKLNSKLLNAVREYVAAFYNGIKVLIAPSIQIDQRQVVTKRRNKTVTNVEYCIESVKLTHRIAHPYDMDKVVDPETEKQFAVGPMLHYLGYEREKYDDSLCLLCLTMEDLYDGKTDSFVAGMAAGGSQIGLFSFCRYDPNFRKVKEEDEEDQDETAFRIGEDTWTKNELLLLQRGCKIAVHEIGHMIQIGHCVYYSCCMNGSGHLLEDYRQPIHLCPVDTAKLLHETKSDVLERYVKLRDFFEKYQMTEESEWVSNTISVIENYRKPHAD